MQRDNIEFMVGWLDALRRDDRAALTATLDDDIVWQGLRTRSQRLDLRSASSA